MNTKTILITGARSLAALDLARTFSKEGHNVICADNFNHPLCRYSKHVSSYFQIAPPKMDEKAFVEDLKKIIRDKKVDLIIPTCEEIFYLAQLQSQLPIPIFAPSFACLDTLHNKWKFYQLLSELSLVTPETACWTGQELKEGKWVIKPVYSRFGSEIQFVENQMPPYDPNERPLRIAQRFVEGEKCCSYSVCKDGEVKAHGAYRVLHSIKEGAAICFESIRCPQIEEIVFQIVKKTNFTGQIAFDFIKGDQVYCIECNPRATSGVHLFKTSSSFANSFFFSGPTLYPKEGELFHEHLMMLWYGIQQKEIFSKTFWNHFFKGKSPLLQKGDRTVLKGLLFTLKEIGKLTRVESQGFCRAMTQGIDYNGEEK